MIAEIILIFVSSSCTACEALLPAIWPLMKETQPDLQWAMIVKGKKPFMGFRRHFSLNFLLIAQSAALNDLYQVKQTPYVLLIAKSGDVLAKGLTNTMEHIESILQSRTHSAVRAAFNTVSVATSNTLSH